MALVCICIGVGSGGIHTFAIAIKYRIILRRAIRRYSLTFFFVVDTVAVAIEVTNTACARSDDIVTYSLLPSRSVLLRCCSTSLSVFACAIFSISRSA